MSIPSWTFKTPEWDNETFSLLVSEVTEIPDVKLADLIEKSNSFPVKFPVDTGRCKTLKNDVDNILERNINSTYPVIHENALHLYANYILLKRKHGNSIEKNVFKDMTIKEFVDRLLKKRAVKFMGRFDSYKLLNGKKGTKSWETIGTPQEKSPLTLKECISYEEIKLSVFLSVSSYSYFVNIGDRKNMAVYEKKRDNIAKEGIIVGVIGTRLKKANVMEYQEMVIDKNQNTKENGYGISSPNIHNLFADFYGEKPLLYEELEEIRKTAVKDRFTSIAKDDLVFDNHVYYKRMVITVDTLLIEANERAKVCNTSAFIHVVGLGLGVWRISPHQEKVYVDIFAERIRQLGPRLHNVSDIVFSYINYTNCGGYKDGEKFSIETHPLKGIKIQFCKRNPHEKLKNTDDGKLLVVSYAWDGNALPGNEYWDGKLGSSGDSAAASSTQIVELHNPHINPKVSSDNLRIITSNGIVTLKDYQEQIRLFLSKRKHVS